MDLTAGTKATAVTAAVVMAVGLTIVLYGLIVDDFSRSLAGACLTITALVLGALVAIHSWIKDTSEERRNYAAATREKNAERSRYIAAQAALENEQQRLNRDMARERAALAAKLITEREALLREFEEQRATLICETMEATILMIKDGRLAPGQSPVGNLIPFPGGQTSTAAPARERSRERGRERSREHGIVGP